jgi:hypothetical protein
MHLDIMFAATITATQTHYRHQEFRGTKPPRRYPKR